MNSEQTPIGLINFNAQGNVNSPVDVNILLGKSYEYNNLLDQLNTQQKLFNLTPEDEIEERLEISKKINGLKDLIEQLKRDVLQLAEQFNRIEIKTGRLQQAREFFEKGEFGEARALLNDDEEEIQSEEEFLWVKRESYKDIEAKLKAKAEERLIQALLNQSNYANPNWFADTCENFERSIKSDSNKFNVVLYAVFLQKHNQFNKAEKYYCQCFSNFGYQLTQDEKAMFLSNLALIHKAQKKYNETLKELLEVLQIRRTQVEVNPNTYSHNLAIAFHNLGFLYSELGKKDEATNKYEEALQIYKDLVKNNLNACLPDMALTLTNLAIEHVIQEKYEEALKEYNEALHIYFTLHKANPNAFLSDIAATLDNLGNLYQNQNKYKEAFKEYKKALQIRRTLAETNPNAFLPDVAITLNNFASLHINRKQLKDALQMLEESTKIFRELTTKNFQAYFHYLAGNLINLALFYQQEIREREKSIVYAIEAITILLPYVEKVPFTQENFVKAWTILQKWNLSDEDIQRLVDEKMEETGKNWA